MANLSRHERSLITKLRTGTLPLAIETGRFRKSHLKIDYVFTIHPCVDSINFAYLAFQGHCRRVTHSFRNVSPWTSLPPALSGDISLNPGPGSRSLNGCLLNVRSIRNKSASFLEFVKDNNLIL